MSLSVKFKAYCLTSSLLIEFQLKSATDCRNKLKSPWLYNHSSRRKDFYIGFFKVNITYNGEVQWLSGRVFDSRPGGPQVRASPASLHCGP